MGSVIPNRINDALIEGSENIFDAILARAMQRELLLQQESEFARSHDLNTRKVDLTEQAQSMETLLNIAPFLPEDVPLSQLEEVHPHLQTVFPGVDPVNGDLGTLVLNQKTFQDVIQPALIQRFESMPEEAKNRITERGIGQAVIGSPVSGTELEIQESVAKTALGGLENLLKDPNAVRGIVRKGAGLEVPIRVLYNNQEYVFDTEAAAAITAELWKNQELMNFRWGQMGSQQKLDVAAELMKQMELHEITIGRPAALRIVDAFQRTQQLASAGKLTPENNPLALLRNNSATTAEEKAAIDTFTGALSYAEQSINSWLERSPEGRQALMFIGLGQRLREAGIPSEEIPELLDNMTGQIPGSPTYRGPGLWGVGNTLEIISDSSTPDEPTGAGPKPESAQPGGEPTLENLRATMTADAEAYAKGEISLQDLKSKYSDSTQRTAVVKQGEMLKRRASGKSNR